MAHVVDGVLQGGGGGIHRIPVRRVIRIDRLCRGQGVRQRGFIFPDAVGQGFRHADAGVQEALVQGALRPLLLCRGFQRDGAVHVAFVVAAAEIGFGVVGNEFTFNAAGGDDSAHVEHAEIEAQGLAAPEGIVTDEESQLRHITGHIAFPILLLFDGCAGEPLEFRGVQAAPGDRSRAVGGGDRDDGVIFLGEGKLVIHQVQADGDFIPVHDIIIVHIKQQVDDIAVPECFDIYTGCRCSQGMGFLDAAAVGGDELIVSIVQADGSGLAPGFVDFAVNHNGFRYITDLCVVRQRGADDDTQRQCEKQRGSRFFHGSLSLSISVFHREAMSSTAAGLPFRWIQCK